MPPFRTQARQAASLERAALGKRYQVRSSLCFGDGGDSLGTLPEVEGGGTDYSTAYQEWRGREVLGRS